MTTWVNTSKNTSSYSTENRNISTFTEQSHAQNLATAGQYYGFGAFTYSGGEGLGLAVISWSTTSKS